jgi:hypothetical protein
MTQILRRKEVSLGLIWITVLIVFADYFFGGATLGNAFTSLTVNWSVIISNIAIFVGGLAVFQRSIVLARMERVEMTERFMYGWQALIAAFLFILGSTLGIQSSSYSWIYNYILLPSWQTIYTLIIFYMATASYRAFRARTAPAAVMLICAIFVLLRNAPIGEAVWTGFYDIGQWILDVVNLGGSRAIMIGAMIGATSLLIRILIGQERVLGEE